MYYPPFIETKDDKLETNRINRHSMLQVVASSSIAFAIAMIIVFFHHYPLIPVKEVFNPADTCKAAPTDCWDGYNKPNFKCIEYKEDTEIRPGVVVKKGETNCYKSIYFNVEPATLQIVGWMFLWFYLTIKSFEKLCLSVFDGTVRLPVASALVLGIPSTWYVCSLPLHYINDRYFPMYWSQIYFTVTELFCVIVNIVHISRHDPVYPIMILLMGGTALSHIVELFMDEPFWVMRDVPTSLRNFGFVIGDLNSLLVAWLLSSNTKKFIRNCVVICVIEIVAFQIFFADFASFKIL